MQSFDLIVIGSGAGLIVAEQAAATGMRVALFESGPLGGTCLNRGCIPSKMLIRSADVMETARRAHIWGVRLQVDGVDWARVTGRVVESVEADQRELELRLQEQHVTLIRETARFTGPKLLEAGGERYAAEAIVIAAGSRPSLPEVPGLEGIPYLTSDDVMWLPSQPRSMVIVGAGDVAAELAHFFGALGTEVTIVNRGEHLLSKEDADVSARFTEVYSRKFRVISRAGLTGVSREDGGVRVELTSQGRAMQVWAEKLLLATGRTPNSDGLNLAATGVETDEKGFIRAGAYLETDVPGIWTLGDIGGRFMLRHSANLEAEQVAHNLLHPADRQPIDYDAMPHAVFGSPQVGVVGLTEAEARDRGRRYVVGRAAYIDTAYGEALDDRDGFVKVIADAESHEILGCHVIGTDAAILVQEVANAMRRHETTEAITGAVYIHPALSEVVKDAFGSIRWPA